MATDTDLVASKAAALRLAQEMGCSGAHQHPDGKWMPCATMKEYEELVKKDKKNTVRVVEQRRRYRNSKGKNKRDWEPLAERGITAIDTIAGGGLVSGSVKVAPWAPDEEDPDVFSNPRLARRRSRQLGCIGISRRVSRNGNVVWMPCSNMTDYAKRTGSTAFGRNFQRRRAQRTLERAVAREVRRQLRRKKSLMEELYEGKALGRKLNRARVAATTPFNPDARDADMDMLVQEGTPWERPARPRVPGLASARTGRRRAERWADRAQRRRNLERDRRAFERDMRDPRINPPVTETEIDEMAEYYEFAEATGAFKSVRGFKLTEEEQRDLSESEKAAKYRKATLDGVGEEHRGKSVRRIHWVYGAPGSGKTAKTNLGHLAVPDTSEAAHTNPDDYKRFHPLWNYGEGSLSTHDWSRGESAKTIRAALKEGMDVVVQGTGKDGLLMNATVFENGDYKKGRRRDTASVMHFLHVPDADRARRIFDRSRRDTPVTGQSRSDQRRRHGAEPEDAMNVLDQVVKFIEEGRVDEAHIYDNSGPLDEPPTLVASFKDGNLVIYDEDKFETIFNPTDHNGQPTLFRGPVADKPRVTRYSRRDDPRRGKTYAERLREEGENPGGFRKWDEEQREQEIRESKARRAKEAAQAETRRLERERRDAAAVGVSDGPRLTLPSNSRLYRGAADDALHVSPHGESGPGIYTSPDRAVAEKYASAKRSHRPAAKVTTYTTTRPLRLLDRSTAEGEELFRLFQRDPTTGTSLSGEQFIAKMKAEGYDGVSFQGVSGEAETVIYETSLLRATPAQSAGGGDPDSYRGSHQAPTKSQEGGDTLDNLTNMLPLREGESNRDRVRLYGSSSSDPEYRRANDEMEAVFDAVTDKPDEIITVYRAVPSSRDASENDQINPGDWVSPSPTYAAIHGEGPLRGEYDIVETRVRAGDLVSEGNSLYEFGWDPEPDPVRLSYYTALDGLTEKEAEAVVDLLGPRGFRSHRDDVHNSKANRGIGRVSGDASSYTLKKGNDDYDRMVKVGYVFEPITGSRGHSGGVFPPDRVLDSIRGWALEQGLQGADLEPHPRTPLDGTILPPFIPEEVVEKVIEKIYRNHYDRIGDHNKIKRKGFDSFVKKLKAGQLPKTVESGEDTIDWNAMVPLEPDDIVLINDEHWEAINEVLKNYGITPDLKYIQNYGQRNNSPSKKKSKAGNKDDAHHGTLKWLHEHLKGPTRGVFRDERDDDGKPIRTVITDEIIDEDMKRIASGKAGWLGAVPMSSQTKGARLSDYTKLGYERNRDNPRGPRLLYSFGQGDVNGMEHWTAGVGPYRQGGDLQTDQQKTLNQVLEDLDDLAKMFGETGTLDPATQDLLDKITGETKKALKQSHEGPLSKERMKQIDDAVAEALAATYQDNGSGGGGSLASRRDDDGESLQDAYRRHLKATKSLTQSEQAFEEQYGYELSSGDGDCYSASYRAAMELVEKGVDVDGDPITNVRVVVGSPIFPAIGNRSGHAWVEYDVVKPPPPVMSSADTERAREQILELVEEMGLPPKQKQATIDSFVEAIDRANEANASMPARDVTMVRDYASVRDGDEILEFDDMDRGRLEELKPDMTRDEYYAAGEMEEVDIAGRFSPAEYEETQVGLFGDNFYDGDATFLTRKQVDDHLEDMGIDGGLESKRTDDADAEDVRLHDEAIEQLREIFAEAGAEQSDTILDQLAYEMRASPRGMMGGDSRPIKPEHLEAIRELVDERDPEFMEDLVESQRIRQTTAGYRRLTESGLDSGVGNHGETTTRVRGLFDAHIEDGDPITLYHGGPVDLTGDVDYEVSRNDSGQWGPGIYTTSSAFPAIKGWANPWQRNAEGGYDTVDPGHLHTTRWKGENPPRILDVMDPLPDDVLDEVVLPAIEALLREIKTFSRAERKDNWKIEWLEEELEATLDFIADKRGEVTGPETLLQLQKYMQESDVKYGRGELDGFLPSDRVDLIRNQMNAAIKDLGYDVIKSHEVGIREMSRTDYMFLDPDMVEFVDVATTHSLGGFGNAAQGEMAETVWRRVKARKEAA